jgi:rare lipoprotein A
LKQIFIFLLFFPGSLFAFDKVLNPDTGKASFYHDMFHGRITSNGEIYDKNDFTAAHKTLPFNTLVMVTNKQNGKSVVVRINDRGPFKKSRVIDLSYAAAKKIGMVPFGVVPVRMTILSYLNPLPVNEIVPGEKDYWNSFGKKRTLENKTILVWQTENIYHAFYMLSSLELENHLGEFVIKYDSERDRKNFLLLLTGVDQKNIKTITGKLKKEGFISAKYFHSDD